MNQRLYQDSSRVLSVDAVRKEYMYWNRWALIRVKLTLLKKSILAKEGYQIGIFYIRLKTRLWQRIWKAPVHGTQLLLTVTQASETYLSMCPPNRKSLPSSS